MKKKSENHGHLTPPLSPLGAERERNLTTPALVEYVVDGRHWRCGRFDVLCAELGEPAITADTLPLLHNAVIGQERKWMILRRLFGIQPVLLPPEYPLDDMKSWQRDELCEALGMTRAHLKQELDGIRGVWISQSRVHSPESTVQGPQSGVQSPGSAPGGELALEADRELLQKYGLPVTFEDSSEREFFVARAADFQKVFEEKTTSGLARSILMTELQLGRIDRHLADRDKNLTGGKSWCANMKQRKDLDDTYQKQLEQLRKLAPWFSAVAGKYAFAGVLSDISKAMQIYYARGDTTLADGIFTMTEIEVELRRSVQSPEPRYRSGLVVYWNMAKAFLFDPKFKNTIPARTFKKLDAGFNAAVIAEDEAQGNALPDLENEGEYPNLETAAEAKAKG